MAGVFGSRSQKLAARSATLYLTRHGMRAVLDFVLLTLLSQRHHNEFE